MSRVWGVGGAQNSTSGYFAFNGYDVYSDGIPWVSGNTDINGSAQVYIEGCGMTYLTGSAYVFINKDGVHAPSGWVNGGGTALFGFHKTTADTSYFGRNTGGSPSPVRNNRNTTTFAGCLTGSVTYSLVPGPCTSIGVGAHPTVALGARITVSGATDDGGNAITAHRVYQSVNGGGWTLVDGNTTGVTLLTGLTAGASYVFSATAVNSRGESYRIQTGAYIPTNPANINRHDGTSFGHKITKRYDGSTSAQAKMKYWTGSAWADTK